MGGVSALALASGSTSAFAQKKYDDGVTDTEIKIGNTNLTAAGLVLCAIARTIDAYFKPSTRRAASTPQISSSRDDGYSPPQTVEVVRQLVEQERSSRCSSRSARRATRRSTST